MCTLSIVVLTKDKKDIVPQTLPSVAFADEVIVEVCGEVPDFAVVRNRALAKAKGEWVLFVDSDEEVTRELAREIKNQIKDTSSEIQDRKIDKGNETKGYFIRRRDYFGGRWLLHGETGNIKLLRLARKGVGKWQRRVHETWNIVGTVGMLQSPLLHFPHPKIGDFVDSINYYTEIDAHELVKEGKLFSYWKVAFWPLGKFIQNYFLRLGFLDGFAGLVVAFMMSFHSLIVRVKMYEVVSLPNHDFFQTS